MIQEKNTQKEKILAVISEFINVDKEVDFNFIESVVFVKMVIKLEETFHIQFEDEMLSPFKFPTVDSFIEYITSKME